MTTLTFKVKEEEASSLRAAARRAQLTLSAYLRQQLQAHKPDAPPVGRLTCPDTGAIIFAPAAHLPPLTTETVNRMLADFP